MSDRPIFYVLAGLAVAAGPALAGYFVYKGLTESRMADRYVTVKGLVERVEKADYGIATVGYKVAGDDLVALNNQLAQQTKTVVSFFETKGFPSTEISTAAPRVIDTQAREYGGQPAPFRYILQISTSVASQNVDALTKISSTIGELVNQGINMSSFNTRYQLKKFNDLRPVMVAEATRNAKELALQFAENSGSEVGGIRRANQGAMRIMSADASPNESWDSGDSSVMKKIRVVSTLDFYLKN